MRKIILKRSSLSKRINLNLNTLIVVLIVLVCSVGLLYLVEFNKISTMGILIDEYKDKRDKLIVENETWNMRIANLKSLDVIENQNVIKKMVPLGDVEFINPLSISN